MKKLPSLLIVIFVLVLVSSNARAQSSTKKTSSSAGSKDQSPKVLATDPPVDPVVPHVEPPSETCNYEDEGETGIWKFRQIESSSSILKYFWLGPFKSKWENNFVGINTSLPSSVLEVNFPRNLKAVAGPGLTVSTGENCSKVGLVAGSKAEHPSWVGSYYAKGENIPDGGMPFQVRAGIAEQSGFWNPSEGTFIHLNPNNNFIGINNNDPNATLDVRGDVHASSDIRTDQNLRVAQSASIGFEGNTNPPQTPNGLTVVGKVLGYSDLEVGGNATMGSGRVQNLGEGLVSATSNGSLQNSTASQVRTLLDIDGVYQFLPVFKPNGGLGNSAIRMGKTPSNFFAIGYGLSNNSAPIYAHHQFGDLVTLHVDGGTAQFGYNTYSSLESSSGAWSYPKINSTLGASKMVQGADGSITFRTLQPNETPTQWEAALTMRGDRKVGIGTEQPEEKLHVVGNIFAENLRLSGNNGNLGEGLLARNANGDVITQTNAQVLEGFGISGITGTEDRIVKYKTGGGFTEGVMQEKGNGDVYIGKIPNTGFASGDVNQDHTRKGASLFFEGGLPGGTAPDGSYGPNNWDALFIQRFNHGFDKTSLRVNIGDDGGQDKLEVGYYKHDDNKWYQGIALYANGELWAKKVKVTTNAFDDYVFAPNYKLPTLKETEEFIQRNGHLPDVPCAEEVIENGLDLTQINRALLKKVEEMTLHLIRMEKEIEELKSKK